MDVALLSDLLGIEDLDRRLHLIERRLTSTVAVAGPAVANPSLRVTLGGGKRLRPALVVAGAALGDVFDEAVIASAAAIELVQVGSLVHDDLFDRAATRRGVPTINAVEGDDVALMSGDYLLARAGAEAASAGTSVAADIAATVAILCVGQLTETNDLFNVDRTVTGYLKSIDGKTAELFAASCRVGAYCAALDDATVRALGAFGRSFGMAFQVLDDVLDLVADPERFGKPVGIDLTAGVYSLPVLYELAGREGPELRSLLARGKPTDLVVAMRLLGSGEGIVAAIRDARRHARAAVDALGTLDLPVDGLRTFPDAYLDWALDFFGVPQLVDISADAPWH